MWLLQTSFNVLPVVGPQKRLRKTGFIVNIIPDALNIPGSLNVEKMYSNEGHSHFRLKNGFVCANCALLYDLCYHAAFRSA